MTSIVYPLKSNTKHNCLELKYSLRSIEKYLKNVGEVFIVTDELPEWITNVQKINGKDYLGMRNKEFNIATKVCSACLDNRVSNPFLFLNDDHYLLSEHDANTFPNYYFGEIKNRLLPGKEKQVYYQSCLNTKIALEKAHRGQIYFDVHSPILYTKEQFLRIIKALSWKNNCGYVIKSLYGNMMQLEGVEYPDCKLTPPFDPAMLNDRLWFSNGNLVVREHWIEVMEKLFPKKSKYEI